MNQSKSRKSQTSRRTYILWLSAGALGLGLAVTTARGESVAATAEGSLSSLVEEKLGRPQPSLSPGSSSPEPAARGGSESDASVDAAFRLALLGIILGVALFACASWVKRGRERRLGADLGANLIVKESIWIGKGQRILVLAFEHHRVLVGVSGGVIHNLGVFGEKAELPGLKNPIERAAARKIDESEQSTLFSDFVRGELAEALSATGSEGQQRRRKMISELNAI